MPPFKDHSSITWNAIKFTIIQLLAVKYCYFNYITVTSSQSEITDAPVFYLIFCKIPIHYLKILCKKAGASAFSAIFCSFYVSLSFSFCTLSRHPSVFCIFVLFIFLYFLYFCTFVLQYFCTFVPNVLFYFLIWSDSP